MTRRRILISRRDKMISRMYRTRRTRKMIIGSLSAIMKKKRRVRYRIGSRGWLRGRLHRVKKMSTMRRTPISWKTRPSTTSLE